MKPTINERILMLKTESGLSNLEFCHKAKISHGTLHNIQNGENVSPKTIQTLCEALNLNREWLLTGNGKRHNEEKAVTGAHADVWRDETYKSLQDRISELKDQIQVLKATIAHVSGGKLNFLELFSETSQAEIIEMINAGSERAAA